ncbi:MAG TPA: c-type cytochrome domain-containing protein [Chthonomonadaceae bacterium]|nr:c-type cytochrome domain-containing protein [Chthonomonadaceae bacterium]
MIGFTWRRGSTLGVIGMALCLAGAAAHAQTSYTAPDASYRFDYPQRWKVAAQGEKLQLTAPDGSRFTLQLDPLTSPPPASPANDPNLKAEAAKRIASVLKDATFVRAQSLSMDHGQGASFRFKASPSGDDATADVWIGLIGKHSIFLLPERAGQSSQTIGLSVIFQSFSFADALPKPASPPARPNNAAQTGNMEMTGTGSANGVSYTRQIAPILESRCRACHNSSSSSGGLDVTSYAALLKGGASGACILPGKPGASPLLDYLTGRRDQMPKGSQPLSQAQIAQFRQWIAGGAQDDSAGGSATRSAGTPNGANGSGRNAGAQPGARPQRPAGGNAGGRDAGLLEGYSGHLAQNDLSFSLRLMKDNTATAVWSYSAQSQAQFRGAYTGQDGTYFVTLNYISGTLPFTVKTLTLNMRSYEDKEIGRYGLDVTMPNRQIMLLELSELGGSINRNAGNGSAGAPGRRPGGRNGK